MSHRQTSVRERCALRLRGLAVVLTCAGLTLPLLHASGGGRSATVEEVVTAARGQVGDTYLWGGNGPDAWDCSGLTSFAWGSVGQVAGMPRVSGAQQRWAVPLPKEQLLAGDLVFYGEPVTHVALYVGDGRVVDASSARRGVVERPLWSAAVTRYGRVPRPDMPAVAPWTPPAPTLAPASAGTVADTGPAAPPVQPRATTAPAAAPGKPPAAGASTVSSPTASARPTAVRPVAPRPAAVAVQPARATPTTARPARPVAVVPPLRPLPGLPAAQARPSSARALTALTFVRTAIGTRTQTDVGIVRNAWRHAGGALLPVGRDALVARGVQVARPDVRVGDLVVYGTPARQLYVYAGKGYMVGHSPEHRAVVTRRVHTGDVRFVRLRG